MNRETQVWQLMSRPVRRLSTHARVRDAAEFLRRWGISGAPVIDQHGDPVGVFSLRDLAAHVGDRMLDVPMIDPGIERARATGEPIPTDRGFHFEAVDDARVQDFMTPAILCVEPESPIEEAVRVMQKHSIHRVFVRRGDGPLEGVLTTMDILRWVGGLPREDRAPAGITTS